MATPQVQSTTGSLLSGFCLAAALTLGSVWTAMAVVDGNMGAVVARFMIAIGAGLFYLTLLRVARRPGL